jgi:hypothetical protein
MLDGISAQELEHMGADGDQIAVFEDGATLQSPPVQKCTVALVIGYAQTPRL